MIRATDTTGQEGDRQNARQQAGDDPSAPAATPAIEGGEGTAGTGVDAAPEANAKAEAEAKAKAEAEALAKAAAEAKPKAAFSLLAERFERPEMRPYALYLEAGWAGVVVALVLLIADLLHRPDSAHRDAV